jgi:predicted amidophosphoribosyltransferase
MKCPACGAGVDEGADICLACGEPMSDVPFARAEEKPRKRRSEEEPEPRRCPGCGLPSRRDRCPGCGTVLRRSDD